MSDSYEKHKLVLVDFCFGSLFFWTCDNLRIFSLGKCFYATVGSGAYSECILCTLDQSMHLGPKSFFLHFAYSDDFYCKQKFKIIYFEPIFLSP